MPSARSFGVVLLVAAAVTGTAVPVLGASPQPVVPPHASALTGATSPSPGPDGASTPGFPTPEAAIREYLAGIAQGDVERILGAAAIDEIAQGFQFDLQVDRLQAMELVQSLAPTDDPFYVHIDRALVTSQILSQVRNLSYSLLSTEQVDGTVITPADKARADAFAAQLDTSRLAGLEVQDIRFSNAKLAQDPRYLANAAAQASVYGAAEQTERLALVSLEGKLYMVGFSLLRYPDGWKVQSQVAPLGGTSSLGTAQPTTREDYDRVTSGD